MAAGSVTENHYADDSDNPAWTTTRPGFGQAGATTRYVPSLGGGVAAQLSDTGQAEPVVADPAGNNVTAIPVTGNATAATGITAWTMYDEYGTVTTGQQPASGYGHLGQYQRATTSDTHGLTLMGRRLYNPTRATFTSTDPIPGGNENPYNYPNDPINTNDTSGMLNVPEVALCAANPYLCTRAKAISNMAIRLTEGGRYLPRTENAIRHFIWQATLTVELGATWAKAWGDAHEVGSKDARDSRIDLSNKWRARWWATRTMSRLKEIRREGRERMMRYLRWKAETLVRSGFLR